MLIFGVIFLLAGLVAFVFLGQTVVLTCDRSLRETPCKIERSLLGIPIKTIPMHSLRYARLDESEDSDGDTTYRVTLVTDEQALPLTPSYSSAWGKRHALVEEINAFLDTPARQTLEAKEDDALGVIFSFVFILVGVGVMVLGTQYLGLTWIFDKTQGLVTRQQKKWGRWEVLDYPLNQIKAVDVECSHDSDGDDTYRVALFMASGERVPLTSVYTSGWKGMQRTAEAIRQFLGLGGRSSQFF